MRERQQLENALGAFDRIVRELDDNVELVALGEEEGDENVVAEAEKALVRLRQEAHTREVEALLSGEADANDAYVKNLVTRVVPDAEVESQTLATARRIANGAPLVARWHRQAARQLEAGVAPTAEQVDSSYACYDTEDFQIGLNAFIAKAKPQFKGK